MSVASANDGSANARIASRASPVNSNGQSARSEPTGNSQIFVAGIPLRDSGIIAIAGRSGVNNERRLISADVDGEASQAAVPASISPGNATESVLLVGAQANLRGGVGGIPSEIADSLLRSVAQHLDLVVNGHGGGGDRNIVFGDVRGSLCGDTDEVSRCDDRADGNVVNRCLRKTGDLHARLQRMLRCNHDITKSVGRFESHAGCDLMLLMETMLTDEEINPLLPPRRCVVGRHVSEAALADARFVSDYTTARCDFFTDVGTTVRRANVMRFIGALRRRLAERGSDARSFSVCGKRRQMGVSHDGRKHKKSVSGRRQRVFVGASESCVANLVTSNAFPRDDDDAVFELLLEQAELRVRASGIDRATIDEWGELVLKLEKMATARIVYLKALATYREHLERTHATLCDFQSSAVPLIDDNFVNRVAAAVGDAERKHNVERADAERKQCFGCLDERVDCAVDQSTTECKCGAISHARCMLRHCLSERKAGRQPRCPQCRKPFNETDIVKIEKT